MSKISKSKIWPKLLRVSALSLLLSLNACVVFLPFIESDLPQESGKQTYRKPTTCNIQDISTFGDNKGGKGGRGGRGSRGDNNFSVANFTCYSANGKRTPCSKTQQKKASNRRVKLLIHQLNHKDPAARTNAATDLGQLGPKAESAIGPLVHALHYDKSKWVRRAAAKSLPKISRNPTVYTALQRATKDSNKWVAHSASRALGSMGISRGRMRTTPMFKIHGNS